MTREEIRKHIRDFMEKKTVHRVNRKERVVKYDYRIERIKRTTLRRYA